MVNISNFFELLDNKEEPDDIKALVTANEFSNIMMKDKISKNYNWQDEYVLIKFDKAMSRAEKELFKKWNLDDGIYIEDEVGTVILDELVRKYSVALNMAEVKNKEVLDNCMNKVIELFNKKLDGYAKEYKLDNELIEDVKKDVPNIVSKYFLNAVNRLFNDNKTRNKLSKLCDELENAYKESDFEQMENITNEISKEFPSDKILYRDKELYYRLSLDVCLSTYISNRIKNGCSGELTDIEKEIIWRFSYIDKEKDLSDEFKERMQKFVIE